MPKVTLYIRNEDYEKWKAVEGKTEFVHNALFAMNDSKILRTPGEAMKFLEATRAAEEWPEPSKNPLVNGEAYARGYAATQPIKTKKEAIMSVPRDDWKPCKHGADPNMCKFKKPGKPCK